jgi:hypothetical protein
MSQAYHWSFETSGKLKPAVIHYLDRTHQLGPDEIEVLKAYLRQWIDNGDWKRSSFIPVLKARADTIASRSDLDVWTMLAIEAECDPWRGEICLKSR